MLLFLYLATLCVIQAQPDLVPDIVYAVDTMSVTTTFMNDPCLLRSGCIPGLGKHRLLRFGIRIHNIAFGPNADFEVGRPNANDSRWHFHDCHGHWHRENYVNIELLFADEPMTLRAAATSKHSFCLRDSKCGNRHPGIGRFGCAYQGIHAGCYDEYDETLPCQWLIIDNLPVEREYIFRITVDPENDFVEQDKQNNVVETRFTLLDVINATPVFFRPNLFVLCFAFFVSHALLVF